MKIIYVANHGNRNSDDTEGHISLSLERLGHEVVKLPQSVSVLPEGDILLYHKWHPLPFDGLKVCWYFDKIWKDRVQWMEKNLELSDYVFMTDEAWSKRNPNPKIRILRQGIGDRDTTFGKFRPEYQCDIAFTGSVYEQRVFWVRNLRLKYRDRFKVFNSVFNRDLYDLCASAKILIAPFYPSEDYYWSNRIYLTLGSGGFMIHPYFRGLESEYTDGVHYVSYTDNIFEKIDFYLENEKERNEIRLSGYNKTITDYTFTKRCEELIGHLNIGTKE